MHFLQGIFNDFGGFFDYLEIRKHSLYNKIIYRKLLIIMMFQTISCYCEILLLTKIKRCIIFHEIKNLLFYPADIDIGSNSDKDIAIPVR